MTNVYVVSQGEYSDRRIVAIFSKKEDADAFAGKVTEHAHYSGDGGDVECWEVDAVDSPSTVHPWRVETKCGTVEVGEVAACHSWSTVDEDFRKVTAQSTDQGLRLWTQVWARDKEHATKIAADRFREHVANTPHLSEVIK